MTRQLHDFQRWVKNLLFLIVLISINWGIIDYKLNTDEIIEDSGKLQISNLTCTYQGNEKHQNYQLVPNKQTQHIVVWKFTPNLKSRVAGGCYQPQAP